MMTSQGRIGVQCVTKGLHTAKLSHATLRNTPERTCIHVRSVRNASRRRAACLRTSTCTAVNTSVPNVANVAAAAVTWSDTGDVTRARNRLNVWFAANGSRMPAVCCGTSDGMPTVTANRLISAINVQNISHPTTVCWPTWIFIKVFTGAWSVENAVEVSTTSDGTSEVTRGRDCFSVVFVANSLKHRETWLSTAEFTAERDRTNVTCVTRRLVRLKT